MARTKEIKTVARTWQLPYPMAIADTIAFTDTAFLNYPMRDVQNDYSISSAFNGNCLVSPIQSRIYFDRLDKIDDPFATAYQPYVYTPQDVRFFNTTTPFSSIAYSKGFAPYREENDIRFLFTGNINRRINLGTQLNYYNSVGHYANQAGKVFNGSVFGSYRGDHYSLHATFAFAQLSNFENGGLTNPEDLGGALKPEDLPVNLNAMSGYRYLSGYLNHYYSITVERPYRDSVEFTNDEGKREWRDTIKINHVPVTTFAHTFETTNSNRRYIEKQAQQGFYPTYYRNPHTTTDSTDVLTIRNTLSVTFEEEFNRILKFGATVYAYNECQRYMDAIGQDDYNPFPDFEHLVSPPIGQTMVHLMPDSLYRYQWTNNTFVGGALYKNRGKYVRFGFDGDVCVLGYKLGEFQVNGHIHSDFRVGKDTMYIAAHAFIKNETPAYYLQHYRSNHFRWDNDFRKTYRFFVGGEIAYPTQWVKPKVNIGFENITRYIYFNTNGLPAQHNGNIQVLSADVQCDITTPWVNLENHVIYQMTSSQYLPLPTITLYHNLYYHGTWFRALDAQIGVDMRYFTSYYAPLLNPATGQFGIQNKAKVGNYPVLNVYANFYVKSLRLRIFAQCTHLNNLFMPSENRYFAMPGYPMNPAIFRAGLAWHFYN